MQEEKTILEHRERAEKLPYASVAEGFGEWWQHSIARKGQGGMTRRQVAEMAYGAGCVLGAKHPSLAHLAELETLPELFAELQELADAAP